MNSTIQAGFKAAMIASVALSIAACSSTPKPAPLGPPAPGSSGPGQYTPPSTGPVSEQPSGAVPGSSQDFVINAGDRIYFDFDAYTIRADATDILTRQAQWLSQYSAVQVRIEGNCDERGTREYNFALGARRANSVRDFLVAHGVSASRITTVSYGKERPIDPGEGEDAWAKDRNAHTTIVSGAS
jgi:peptidoglycan-associated lipoprotein